MKVNEFGGMKIGDHVVAEYGAYKGEVFEILGVEANEGSAGWFNCIGRTGEAVGVSGLFCGDEIKLTTIADDVLNAEPPVTYSEAIDIFFDGWAQAFGYMDHADGFELVQNGDHRGISDAMNCGELEDERERE